jgi:4-amino-4-deoxy-L-arabinose transferase-like glycosyltransferase
MLNKSELNKTVITTPEPKSVPDSSARRLLLGRGPEPRITKPFALVMFPILVVYIGTRLWDLTSYGLFSDEIFSIWVASNSWRELAALVVEDVVHPPLFYILLKLWVIAFGDSLLSVKLFPVLISVAAIVPFFMLCRELRLKGAAFNLALVLMAVNEYLITYSQDLRMYSLVMLMTVTSLWLFARFFNSPSHSTRLLAALFAANLLLVYTHYYGWLVIAIEFFFLLLWGRKNLLSFSIALAFLIACFIPWVYLVSHASIKKGGLVANLGWNSRPTFGDLIWFYQILNGPLSYRLKVFGTPLVRILFGFPVLAWAWQVYKQRRENNNSESSVFSWLALLSFLPALIAFAASHLLTQSVWGLRFLIICVPPYLLLVSIAALRLQTRWLRTVTTSLIISWAAVCGLAQLNNRDKVAWEPLVARMIEAEPVHPGITKVYTEKGNAGTTVQYYLNQAKETRFEVVYIDYYTEPQEDRFWVAYLEYAFEAQPPPQKVLAERGYVIGQSIQAEAAGHKVFLFPAYRR